MSFVFFFFKEKTAYEINQGLEFGRVIFRSDAVVRTGHSDRMIGL